jgi:hypothetical protein
LGCDRALQGEQLYLITNWRITESRDRSVLHFRFVSPSQVVQEITQTLDQAQLFVPLPAGFYAHDRPGTVWLKHGEVDDEQWIQVCKQ